ISALGIGDIGDFLEQWIAVGDDTLIVVGALAAAVLLLPGLVEVIGANGGVGPDMAFAGDSAGVVKIIEHAVLQGELVLIGRDGCAVHGQSGIAIADRPAVLLEIPEDLVVGAVFLDDVDHVLDGVAAAGEGERLLR